MVPSQEGSTTSHGSWASINAVPLVTGPVYRVSSLAQRALETCQVAGAGPRIQQSPTCFGARVRILPAPATRRPKRVVGPVTGVLESVRRYMQIIGKCTTNPFTLEFVTRIISGWTLVGPHVVRCFCVSMPSCKFPDRSSPLHWCCFISPRWSVGAQSIFGSALLAKSPVLNSTVRNSTADPA